MVNDKINTVNVYFKQFQDNLEHNKLKKFKSHKNTDKILKRIENKDKEYVTETLKTIDVHN